MGEKERLLACEYADYIYEFLKKAGEELAKIKNVKKERSA